MKHIKLFECVNAWVCALCVICDDDAYTTPTHTVHENIKEIQLIEQLHNACYLSELFHWIEFYLPHATIN